ncbi:hypothetical protein CAC42_2731 [Sphaceloma murrayae]|uniref:Trafficking protein particle complex subunit 12 n=1 Tax=Sphaceloma murrayae TaxID=2082308 RepID=A0A2K1R0P2_9PEZI|nr:hypothetical protein CAC42_2731 [Sphaceloma murrayae]
MSIQSDLPTRTRSARQAAVRRSTRGPLDDEDPLAPSPTTAAEAPPPASPPSSTTSPRPTPSALLSPPLSALTASSRHLPPLSLSRPTSPSRIPDLTFLTRPQLYSPLPTPQLLPPFLTPLHQSPAPSSTLSDLTKTHSFRHAAIKAASDLCTGIVPPDAPAQILETFHVRLACLVLIGQTEIAAQEARPLADFLARTAAQQQQQQQGRQGSRPGSAAGLGTARTSPDAGIVPWELRVLVQWLSGVGAQDGGRRGIMGLYALGAECRARWAEGKAEEKVMWKERLGELGIRVGAELVRMGEGEAAARHLRGLEGEMGAEVKGGLALLYARMGDVKGAERVIGEISGGQEVGVLRGLVAFARGEYDVAREAFAEMYADNDDDVLVANNYAICLLYTGGMQQAAQIMERLVNETTPVTGTLFNLATMYELATEKAVEKKAKLVERVASRGPENGGWERPGVDFKL